MMARDDIRPRPDEYDEQLGQNDRAGQQGGPDHAASRTAYDMKALHRRLDAIPDNLLKQIPVLDKGTRLKEGAAYLDLAHPEQGEFRGMNDMIVEPRSCVVAKNMVEDYELWNLPRGERNAERLGRFTSVEEKSQAA
jgi:hypothetical protein